MDQVAVYYVGGGVDLMKFFFMFPGQGSQSVGMIKEVLTEFPYTKEIFEQAEDTLKLNIRALCLEGPENELTLTANTQPCLLTTSFAHWTVLAREAGAGEKKRSLFAGHSLGEYSAAVACGILPFTSALKLVRQRGLYMQEAVPVGTGAMTAVINGDTQAIEKICREVSTEKFPVTIANDNSPKQIVIAGAIDAVAKAEAKIKETSSARTIRLPVSAPFHSPLMRPAREKMAGYFEEILRDDPKTKKNLQNECLFAANIRGEFKSDFSYADLIEQIDSPVRWTQTLQKSFEYDVAQAIEVGPGTVLQGLYRKTAPSHSVVKIAGCAHQLSVVLQSCAAVR